MFYKINLPASACAKTCSARKHNPIIARKTVSISRIAILGKNTLYGTRGGYGIEYEYGCWLNTGSPRQTSTLPSLNRASFVAVPRMEILCLSWNKRSMTHMKVTWECGSMRFSSTKQTLHVEKFSSTFFCSSRLSWIFGNDRTCFLKVEFNF